MLNNPLWVKLKQWTRQDHRVLLTAAAVAGCTIALRTAGLLQTSELAALDRVFNLSPPEQAEDRIVIVGIDEEDIQSLGQGLISDAVLVEVIQKIDRAQPRAIGLDVYRNLPEDPGHKEFVKLSQSLPHLIGIERLRDEYSPGVPAPPALREQDQVGFNNVVIDVDGTVRRSSLYVHVDGEAHKSFSLQLALTYLQPHEITPKRAEVNPDYMQLGAAVFRAFKGNDGGYVRADDKGYQFLTRFRQQPQFKTVSMRDVREDRVDPNLIRDRIVLIGSTASSHEDLFYTPHDSGLLGVGERLFGVEVQAHFISQIISAALNEKSLIRVLPDAVEVLWIFFWSWVGASLSWRFRSPKKSSLSLVLAGIGLSSIAYLSFVFYYWIPLIPPMIGMVGSGFAITSHLAYLKEELKRSKEFLQNVIDTIADPVFVKDKQHRLIILNQAYCQFIGYPLETLLYKSELDLFAAAEANTFWEQDQLVFKTGESCESEEKFTNAEGTTYFTATKRSLHQDAAGNLFLVGVIRDITERKRMEENLKQTTAELMRANAELRMSENQLRDLAYHDTLTGLPNRKQFYERLNQSLQLAESNNQLLALLFLDLDGFKQVNDRLGHDMGDRLLKIVAARLKSCLRGSDTVSRLAGDEFTIILPVIPQKETAAIVADKILATLSQPFVLEEHEVLVTASIGISFYPIHGTNAEILIKNADSAMYDAKELGRNRYAFSPNL